MGNKLINNFEPNVFNVKKKKKKEEVEEEKSLKCCGIFCNGRLVIKDRNLVVSCRRNTTWLSDL